ncbi:uroporphyrinogen-III C-methyltransferase [Vibrio gallicus]|uniref:uroporphyrinogen-III C-methyltransferase n=1 Tax=Vibrio gallicus TaxID=190897 RepID=UPI0021C266A0|nr:uroporphyrinogen-III C-methyltransferase [Vibrio gallicus]
MTDEKKLESNNNDTQADVAATQKKQAQPSKETDKKESTKPAKRIAVVALVISIITAGGGVFYIQQQNQLLKQQITQLNSQLGSTQQRLTQQLDSNQKNTEQLAKDAINKAQVAISQQQKSIESLQLAIADVKGRRPNDWLLAEADYLVKLAGRKLFLEHDVVTATKLMESADQRIATLNDPSLVPLRKVMAKDITTLRSLPLLDKDGLVLRIISLQNQVDSLPLANAILPKAEKIEKKEVSTNLQDWQSNLKTSLQNFADNFITFRVRDGSAVPLLSPEQHFYLKENIKAKLETAIKATYSEQEEIYQLALVTAEKWSQTYLNQNDSAVKQFNASLEKLSKVQVNLQYPTKFATNQVLSDIIRERLRREVTTIITEDK